MKILITRSTLALLALTVGLMACGAMSAGTGILAIILIQVAAHAVARPRAALFTGGITAEQAAEFERIIHDAGDYLPRIKSHAERMARLEKSYDELLGSVRRLGRGAGAETSSNGVRWIGPTPFVSDDCARALTSVLVVDCARTKGALDGMIPDEAKRQRIMTLAFSTLGMEQRTALTSNEIPLPTTYVPQIIELVFAYGAARKYGTVFPLGSGLVKLPRLKVGEDEFGFLGVGTAAMSQPVPEKKVTAEEITFTANKAGGLIRIPYELDEDTFIPIGQFLARYIARQMAKLEDKTFFLADGTTTYANITGIASYCIANTAYLLQLGAGKTKPSDVTLDDFRDMRALVSPAILGNMAANGETTAAYYMSPTFEPMLRSFNKYPNFVVFEYVNGVPKLDGFPVRWIGVSQAYTKTGVAPSQPLAFFGDLTYWYLGERGPVRIEISKEVFFQTDEIALRALERIDVEGMAVDAIATLMTAAA